LAIDAIKKTLLQKQQPGYNPTNKLRCSSTEEVIMGERVKIVVFVPASHADAVRLAMGDAGAGKIGSYSHCSYSVVGTGRYMPLEGAKPAIGGVGVYEAVEEERIEAVCERKRVKELLKAVRKVHPYEEAAIDIYALMDEEGL
jgi:hypothetical protein